MELVGQKTAGSSEWRFERGGIFFDAELRLRDEQFLDAVRAGDVRLSRGDVMLLDYRFRSRKHQRGGTLKITVTEIVEHRPRTGMVWVRVNVPGG